MKYANVNFHQIKQLSFHVKYNEDIVEDEECQCSVNLKVLEADV